jgi:hypothetical protein
MPGREAGAADNGATPEPTLWQRITAAFSRPAPDPDRPSLTDRLSAAMLKPAPESSPKDEGPATLEELEEAAARCDDKERFIGLLAAPVAGMIGILVTSSLIANDPKALTATGQVNKRHVNPSQYLIIGTMSLVFAALMLAFAWWRKRMYLGITMALYGLTVFNLHFWGFGVPYLLFGSWYLVRAYRINQKLKAARATSGSGAPPKASKRYTPPTSPPGKPPRATGGDERRAG